MSGPALLILAALGALLRLRPKAERTYVPAIALLAVLAGYFAIFLLTRDDVAWLLDTALERLYLHLWPALVLAAFLLLRPLESFAIPIPVTKSRKAR